MSKFPKIRIIKNTLGTIVGIKINDVLMSNVYSVNLNVDAENRISKVSIDILSNDVEFESSLSTTLRYPVEFEEEDIDNNECGAI